MFAKALQSRLQDMVCVQDLIVTPSNLSGTWEGDSPDGHYLLSPLPF